MYYSGRVDGGARLVDYVRIQDPIESVTPFHGTRPDANLLLTRGTNPGVMYLCCLNRRCGVAVYMPSQL